MAGPMNKGCRRDLDLFRVQTDPEKGWFKTLCRYSPLPACFDKTRQPSKIELVNRREHDFGETTAMSTGASRQPGPLTRFKPQ